MSNARLILVILICASPAVLLLDGPTTQGLVAGVVAVGIAIMGRAMRPGETEFLISIFRPIAALMALPALWILIQILPLPLLAHPIWNSAEGAIGHPIAGSISIDTGGSVMALARYILIGAIALLSAAVAVDRQRAEWVLFSLTTATTLVALTMMLHDLFGHTFLSASVAPLARAQAIDCTALGVILSAAASIRTLERYETRQTHPERSVPILMRTFAASSVALGICGMALTLGATASTIIATGYGLATLLAVMVIRRLGLGPWGAAALAAPPLVIAFALAASEPNLRTGSFALAFAVASPTSLTSLSQRMLDDAPAAGTGAGTFAAIAPIYRDFDDPVADTPATAISALALELGRPMLWLIVASAGGSIIVLFRASLRRGRDSFYPAAGASCLITLLFLSFMNAGLLGTAVAIIAAATLGLAFAQGRSRTI